VHEDFASNASPPFLTSHHITPLLSLSAILLQRKFSSTKWAALIILTVGVAIVQISGSGDEHTDKAEGETAESLSQNHIVGLVAVLCAACTSGFSGVYFEKILKGSRTSLWIRNVQMGLPSIIIAYMAVYFKDGAAVAEHGFLGGYNNTVWSVVIVQAVGGLIVATVVKYADNVLKVFVSNMRRKHHRGLSYLTSLLTSIPLMFTHIDSFNFTGNVL
jgi:UDP-sugar transporter A1/2/3